MNVVDLSGGFVQVIGNSGDEHIFRLSNPIDQELIVSGGEYSAEFITSYGKVSPIELGLTEVSTGVISFTFTIASGIIRVYRDNPRRTMIVVEVDSK